MGDLIGAILAPIFAAIGSLLSAILAPILAPVFELIAIIIGAILHFIFALIANLLGASWLAAHSTGIRRASYILMALTSAHLLAGLLLPAFGMAPGLLLSWLFSGWAMLISLILLMLSAVLPGAVRVASPPPATEVPQPAPKTPAAPGPVQTASIGAAKELVSHGMAFVFAAVVFIGLISLSAAQTERKSLRQRLCESAAAKYEETVSEGWRARASKALKWGEDKLSPEMREKILEKSPCPPTK